MWFIPNFLIFLSPDMAHAAIDPNVEVCNVCMCSELPPTGPPDLAQAAPERES
jgi:hypothetical protein